MMYYGGHFPGLIWLGAAIGMIVFWGIVLFLGALAFRALTSGKPSDDEDSRPAGTDPRQILAERYARGEIDEEEYRRRLATLSGTDDPPGGPPRTPHGS